jgi:hypothetical protein
MRAIGEAINDLELVEGINANSANASATIAAPSCSPPTKPLGKNKLSG